MIVSLSDLIKRSNIDELTEKLMELLNKVGYDDSYDPEFVLSLSNIYETIYGIKNIGEVQDAQIKSKERIEVEKLEIIKKIITVHQALTIYAKTQNNLSEDIKDILVLLSSIYPIFLVGISEEEGT